MKFFTIAVTVALPLLAVARPLVQPEYTEDGYAALDRRTKSKNPLDIKTQNAGSANALTESIATGKTSPTTQIKAADAAAARIPAGAEANVRGGGAHTSQSTTDHLPNSDQHITVASNVPGDPNALQQHTGLTATGSPTGETFDPLNPNKGKSKVKPDATNPNPTLGEAIQEGIKQKLDAEKSKTTRSIKDIAALLYRRQDSPQVVDCNA